MKLIVDEKTDKVIGASMCGPDAAEIMQASFSKQQLQLFTLFFHSEWCMGVFPPNNVKDKNH